jgi:hypothetical protein
MSSALHEKFLKMSNVNTFLNVGGRGTSDPHTVNSRCHAGRWAGWPSFVDDITKSANARASATATCRKADKVSILSVRSGMWRCRRCQARDAAMMSAHGAAPGTGRMSSRLPSPHVLAGHYHRSGLTDNEAAVFPGSESAVVKMDWIQLSLSRPELKIFRSTH